MSVSATLHGSNATPVLTARHLEKSFGGLRAIDDVSFAVGDRQVTALIGPNGAGKTTVFNLLTSVLPCDAGAIAFLDHGLRGLSAVRIAELGLIRTFQSARVFPGMSVLENAMLGRHRQMRRRGLFQLLRLTSGRGEERRTRIRAERMLDLVNLSRFRDVHAPDLPMGAQKLLEIARALLAAPRLLCLDEPAAGLNDVETEEMATLLRAIRAVGIPVLVVEHNMSLVMNVADWIIVLDAGRIIASGTPTEIQRNERVIEAYLGRDQNAVA
jgi:branched-chain amino acid transport system ATP-binding protein